MKKDAIIDIIANDLKEIELLLNNFKGDDNIPAPFIDLLQTKYANLAKEIDLLNFWKAESGDHKEDTKGVAKSEPVAGPTPVAATIEPMEKIEPVAPIEPISTLEPIAEPEPVVIPEPTVVAEPEPVVETPVATPEPVVAKPSEELKPAPTPVAEQPITRPVQTPAAPAAKSAVKASDLTNYGTPVSDIKKAIAIADRFLYQKELFGGKNDELNATIESLNAMESYDDAEQYLFEKYGWDPENATTVAFLKAVRRRFL